MVQSMRERRKNDTKIYLRNLNLILLEDIYNLFQYEIYMQNNYGAVIENATGGRVMVMRSRYSLKPGSRADYLRKRVKSQIGGIPDVIMLSLSTYEPVVQAAMPDNTNLHPVEYAIIHCWKWLDVFQKRIKRYWKKNNVPAEWIGAVLEFQDNGMPHFHCLIKGRWLGNIEQIKTMWDWSLPQGVDVMTKAKWEKKNPGKKYSPLRLANYLSKYLGKADFYDKEKGIHKSHAIAHFYKVRMFNFNHEYKPDKPVKKNAGEWKYLGVGASIRGVK